MPAIPAASPNRPDRASTSPSRCASSGFAQPPLFPEERRRRQVAEAMDAVNDRYGTATVTFGSILGRGGTSRVIAPAWRPEGIRAVDVE